MNPHEHGEVFVLEDGTEVDMDFGHYERFLGIGCSGDWNLTSGRVFRDVIQKERNGEYLGKTVQMVPHVTDHIKEKWRENASSRDADVVMVEVGGTVGDMENQFYLEAVRQMINELPESDTYLVHTTLVPYLETVGEQKTKPTQHSVKKLRELGLEPDMIAGRSKDRLSQESVRKISLFCDVEEKEVISDPNMDTVYRLPLVFQDQDTGSIVSEALDLEYEAGGLEDWRERTENLSSDPVARIALCGKYTEMDDSYASIEEALKHSAVEIGGSVEIEQVDTEDFDPQRLEGFDGVIIPGGFGSRGVEGKIQAIKHCRQTGMPLLGICYGMQLMTIEYARNILDLDASSEELSDDSEHLVIKEMESQKNTDKMGGTMRLGSYQAELSGRVESIYGSETVEERHRHRYELNPEYEDDLESNGLMVSGRNPESSLAEFIELEDHEFFIGTQAHPEFNSSFQEPNPLYLAFLRSCRR
jgi:CTP synthase (EC 6.3.4.2)